MGFKKDHKVTGSTTSERGGVKFVQLRNAAGDVVAEGSGADERTARIDARLAASRGRYGPKR